MDLKGILTQFEKVRDDFAAGKFATAVEDFIPIQQAIVDLARAVGFQAGPDDATTAAEIMNCCDECCALAAHPPKAAADPHAVGKIGDGKILAGLFEWAKVILPLILPLII